MTLVLASGCASQPDLASPSSAPASPSIGHVFVQDDDAIWGFSIDASTGALRSMPGSPLVRSVGPRGFLTAEPRGRFLYHGLFSHTDRIFGYAIDRATDSLKELTGSPFSPQCTNILRLRFLSAETAFAQCDGGPTLLRPLRLDPGTGALTPHATTIDAATLYRDFRIHPSGRFAFVAEGSYMSVYSLRNGGLEWIRSSLLPGDTHRDPVQSLEIVPSGRFLYGAGLGTSLVQAFAIDGQTGSLTRLPTPEIPETLNPAIAVDTKGRFVFATGVERSGEGRITSLRIDDATGALSIVGYARSPGRAGTLAFATAGGFLYHSHPVPPGLSAFRLDEATGGLTLVPGSPFPAYGRDIVTTP